MPQPAPRASSFVQPPEPWAAGGGGVSDRRAGCEQGPGRRRLEALRTDRGLRWPWGGEGAAAGFPPRRKERG